MLYKKMNKSTLNSYFLSNSSKDNSYLHCLLESNTPVQDTVFVYDKIVSILFP
jgi:hypothetical protein